MEWNCTDPNGKTWGERRLPCDGAQGGGTGCSWCYGEHDRLDGVRRLDRLNGRPGCELIDPKTGGRVVLRRRRTLFWVPMQYMSGVLLFVAVFVFFAPA